MNDEKNNSNNIKIRIERNKSRKNTRNMSNKSNIIK